MTSEVAFRPNKNNKTMQTLTRVATVVRKEGPINEGVLAVKCGMAPNTLRTYRSALLAIFQDVRFDAGTYSSLVKLEVVEMSPDEKPPGSEGPSGGS